MSLLAACTILKKNVYATLKGEVNGIISQWDSLAFLVQEMGTWAIWPFG